MGHIMVKIVSNYVRMSVMCHLCLQLTENVVFYLYKTYVWITFFLHCQDRFFISFNKELTLWLIIFTGPVGNPT